MPASRGPTRRRSAACPSAWLVLLLSVLLLGILLPGVVAPARAAVAEFDIDSRGAVFAVQARAHVAAPLPLAWATVTDYEALPAFIPDITSSRIIERRRDGAVEHLLLEQRGALRFLFFTRTVAVRLRIEQQEPSRVVAHHIVRPEGGADDEVRSFDGDYLLEEDAGGTTLSYRARIEPAFDLPPFVSAMLVRRTLRAQFQALVDEIERRAGTLAAPLR